MAEIGRFEIHARTALPKKEIDANTLASELTDTATFRQLCPQDARFIMRFYQWMGDPNGSVSALIIFQTGSGADTIVGAMPIMTPRALYNVLNSNIGCKRPFTRRSSCSTTLFTY